MSLEMIVTNNNLPLLSQLPALMELALKKAMAELGEIIQQTAVEAIQNQAPPGNTAWPQLQEWYIEWKKAKGFSDQTYIMSSSYLQAIVWKIEQRPEDIQLVVGVMRDSGPGGWGQTEIWSIAEILEYGWEQFNVKIPPRPLWRPTLEVNRHKIKTRIGTAIYWSTKKIEKMAIGKVQP